MYIRDWEVRCSRLHDAYILCATELQGSENGTYIFIRVTLSSI